MKKLSCAALTGCMLLAAAPATLHAQTPPAPNAAARPFDLPRVASPPVFTGTSTAIVRDLVSGTTATTALSADDVTLPGSTPSTVNPVLIERPLNPTDLSFGRIEFDGGAGFCSSTAISRRVFLTAGHCVFDKTTRSFRSSAVVYLGYPRDDPALRFKATKLVAFSGWTTAFDYAHDIALVEVERDIPANVPLYRILDDTPRCGTPRLFSRTYYTENNTQQLWIQGTHVGCEGNTMYWAMGTVRGSSGSAAVDFSTRNIYGVYSNFTEPGVRVGHDAWITRAKGCFIKSRFLGQSCNPPDSPQQTMLVLESAHVDVLNTAGFVDITVYRTGSKNGEVAVRYNTVSMSAAYGRDLDNAEGILKWTDGDNAPKTARVKLYPENDPGCERQFKVSFGRRMAGDPPSQILGPTETLVSIHSGSQPASERRLLAQQFVTDFNLGALLSKHIVIPSDGQALYSAAGYDISAHWRDPSRGVILCLRSIHDNAGAITYAPVMSTDGSYVTRVAGPQIKTYTRGVSNPDIVQSSTLPFDYDRYTTWDATSSPDARSDFYVTSNNPNTRRMGILRYERNRDSGALGNKQAIWAGDGGMPGDVVANIRVSRDGRWLFGIQSGGISIFRRDANGLLSFVAHETNVFGGWQPNVLAPSADSKFLFVIAKRVGVPAKLFALSVQPTGALTAASTIDLPGSPADIAVNPDGKEVYLLVNAPTLQVLQYSIDGQNGQLATLGNYNPNRCVANHDLSIQGHSLVVGPEGRFLTIGAMNKGILTLRLDR